MAQNTDGNVDVVRPYTGAVGIVGIGKVAKRQFIFGGTVTRDREGDRLGLLPVQFILPFLGDRHLFDSRCADRIGILVLLAVALSCPCICIRNAGGGVGFEVAVRIDILLDVGIQRIVRTRIVLDVRRYVERGLAGPAVERDGIGHAILKDAFGSQIPLHSAVLKGGGRSVGPLLAQAAVGGGAVVSAGTVILVGGRIDRQQVADIAGGGGHIGGGAILHGDGADTGHFDGFKDRSERGIEFCRVSGSIIVACRRTGSRGEVGHIRLAGVRAVGEDGIEVIHTNLGRKRSSIIRRLIIRALHIGFLFIAGTISAGWKIIAVIIKSSIRITNCWSTIREEDDICGIAVAKADIVCFLDRVLPVGACLVSGSSSKAVHVIQICGCAGCRRCIGLRCRAKRNQRHLDGIVRVAVLAVIAKERICKTGYRLLSCLQACCGTIIVITLAGVLGTIIPESNLWIKATAGPTLQRHILAVDKAVEIRASAVGRAIRSGAGLGIHGSGPVNDHDDVDLLDLFFRVAGDGKTDRERTVVIYGQHLVVIRYVPRRCPCRL